MREVKMLNRNASGPMVDEPDFLEIAPGDTVKFIKTTSGHNAATVEGMVMVIRVGDADLPASFPADDVPQHAKKRFQEILQRNGYGK